MKKMMIPAAFLLFAIACGSNEEKKTEDAGAATTATTPEEPKEDLSANPDYKAGLALVGKNDCLTCHKVNETLTGPAYKDVAAKYANAADSTIDRLAHTIIKGGSGHWGTIPMTPHPNLSVDDAKAMVKYVLLLNK